MMWPRDDEELAALVEAGHGENLKKVYFADDLAHGQNILFCATGISDSALLPGVTVRGSTAITHSVRMRARSWTVRYIKTYHDFETKTIRLRSSQREHHIAEPVSNVPPPEN